MGKGAAVQKIIKIIQGRLKGKNRDYIYTADKIYETVIRELLDEQRDAYVEYYCFHTRKLHS